MRYGFDAIVVLVLVALVGVSGCDKSDAPKSKTRRIAVIPKGMTHEFWKAVEAGARKAAAEIGDVEVDYKSPPKEDDTQQQIALVQSFISTQVDGIVLAPLSDTALVAPVKLATQAGIPTIIIDSPLAAEVGKDFIGYCGTDNYKAGVLAGKRMGELMEGKGTVMMLRYAASSASTRAREDGFVETLRGEFPNIKLIDPPQYAGSEVSTGKKASENMITANMGKFEGVFCPNETSAAGMLIALSDRQLTGKVKFVGFDAAPRLNAGLRDGELQGLVLQDPFKMGYLGLKTMIDHLDGKAIEQSIDTGAAMATPENINDPEIQRLLNPVPET